MAQKLTHLQRWKESITERRIKRLLLEITKEAGMYSLQHFNALSKNQISYKYKGETGIVTEVDMYLDRFIREKILTHFPEHDIISEEEEPLNNKEEYVWIIDPIDGTRNYAYGNVHYSISIGVARGSDLIMGAIYAPALDEFYFAQKGKGFWLNGKRVEKNIQSVNLCYIDHKRTSRFDIAQKHFTGCNEVHLGSAALELAYVAQGISKGALLENIMIWDIAAGIVMVQEMNGKTLNFNNEPYTFKDSHLLALRD